MQGQVCQAPGTGNPTRCASADGRVEAGLHTESIAINACVSLAPADTACRSCTAVSRGVAWAEVDVKRRMARQPTTPASPA